MGVFKKIGELLTGGVGAIAAPIADYAKRRAELKAEAAADERAIRKAQVERHVELIKQGLAADANWEMEFARQAASSYKDEYTLAVVSVPLVLAFVPGMSEYVTAGFAAFSGTPMWYQLMVQVLFYATVGIRFYRRTQSDT